MNLIIWNPTKQAEISMQNWRQAVNGEAAEQNKNLSQTALFRATKFNEWSVGTLPVYISCFHITLWK